MKEEKFSLNGIVLILLMSSVNPGWGRVFIEANGQRFGQDDFDEELDLLFYAAANGFRSLSGKYPHLMNVSPEQYCSLVDSVYDDCYDPELWGVDNGNELVESTILRIEQAFDHTLIGLLSDGRSERIVFKGGDKAEALILPRLTLWNLFCHVAHWVEKNVPTSGFFKGQLSEVWKAEDMEYQVLRQATTLS